MKKELIVFPFNRYADIELSTDVLAPFRQQASWVLPQAMAFLGSDVFPLIKKIDSDIYSFERTWNHWLDRAKSGQIHIQGNSISFDWFKGFFRILNHAPRGEILGSRMTQSKPEGARWAASVPLILSAFKEFRNIPYSNWDFDPKFMQCFVDKNIQSLLLFYPYECPFSEEQLLEIRDETDNGKPITSRTTITTCSNAEFNLLPKYLKTLLCQVWIWNPAVRHRFAITNLQNLDEPAKPLVSSEIFIEENIWGTTSKKSNDDIPW